MSMNLTAGNDENGDPTLVNLLTCHFSPLPGSSNAAINELIGGARQAELLERSFQINARLGSAYYISDVEAASASNFRIIGWLNLVGSSSSSKLAAGINVFDVWS